MMKNFFFKRLSELEERIEIIDNELRKYNLIIDSYDVTKIIDYPIIISAYPNKNREEELEMTLKIIRKPLSGYQIL